MPSKKKSAADKRAPLPLACDYTKQFLKDWSKLSASGKYDMHRLKEVMMLLIENAGPLGAEWLDHDLAGPWKDHRECHAGGDFLLIYQCEADSIIFVRTGTHSQLFK